MRKILALLVLVILLPLSVWAAEVPRLNFSDLIDGPKSGNSDPAASSGGAIVTIWGNNLGETQGTSKVYVGGVEATAIYYWKNADGSLPGKPADMSTFHKMQEICFAVPPTAPDGATTIKVTVGGTDSNTLPFYVRTGTIRYIKSTGTDSGAGTYQSPWKTYSYAFGTTSATVAGDIIYTMGVPGTNITIGNTGHGYIGSETNHTGLIVYPNTTADVYGSNTGAYSAIGQLNSKLTGGNYAYVFSGFTITTEYQAFSRFGLLRVIGNKVTGPNVGSGYSGWVGGSCETYTQEYAISVCSGMDVFGNEVYNYGNPANTNVSHHLYYLANRSGFKLPKAFHIGWNYHHETYPYQSIHVYDMSGCGGYEDKILIHDNVLHNTAGNAINLDLQGTECANDDNRIEVYNNLSIQDADWHPGGIGEPMAPFRVAVPLGTVNIYNNTMVGYGSGNAFSSGTINFYNNILVDNQGIAYNYTGSPTNKGNNLLFSTVNPSLALPSWATGSLNVDPKFTNAALFDFTLATNSPALTGATVYDVVVTDMRGNYRGATSATRALGAFDRPGEMPIAVNGICGSAHGQSTLTPPTANFCSSGTTLGATCANGSCSWTCYGSNSGTNASCSSTIYTQGTAISTVSFY